MAIIDYLLFVLDLVHLCIGWKANSGASEVPSKMKDHFAGELSDRCKLRRWCGLLQCDLTFHRNDDPPSRQRRREELQRLLQSHNDRTSTESTARLA